MAQGNFHITRQATHAVSLACRALCCLTFALASQLLSALAFGQNSAADAKPPSTVENSASTAPAPSPASGPALCQALSEDGQPTCGQEAGNPINVTNGNKFQREVDMPALPGVLGLELVRNYNSASSRLSDAPSMFGRGWRLSYDWALRFDHANKNQSIVLVRGDGTQMGLVKNKPTENHPTKPLTRNTASVAPTSWRAIGAQTGKLVEFREALESEYVWTEPSGQRYRFNAKGWLLRIEAPTGEFLSIEREHKGDITKVTDPQGRILVMTLLSDEAALRQQRFGGVQTVDTPVGRYQYRYGGALPKGSSVDPLKVLSRLIAVEHAGITRHYLFEDVKQAALLTGIRVEGAGSDGVRMNQRIATWAYDSQGRAILSMKGEQEKVTLLFFPRQKNPQGLERGLTLLTNSLGRSTLYRYQTIAGKAQLTEVLGAGCGTCGPTNVRHEYDRNGRRVQTTYLAPAITTPTRNSTNAAGYTDQGIQAGLPLSADRTSYDSLGRPVHRSLVKYFKGQPEEAQPILRLEYPVSGQASTVQSGWTHLEKPILIARPSVIRGKEQLLKLSYNEYGQVTMLREVGFDPIGTREISRTTTFDYQLSQGRSLLIRTDGPLPNGPTRSPLDSDITLYQWDSQGDRILAITEPFGFVRKRTFDDAGRITKLSFDDGVRRVQQALRYAQEGRYALTIESTTPSGWMLKSVSKSKNAVEPTNASHNESSVSKPVQVEPLEVDEVSLQTSAPHLEKHDALGRITQTIDAAGRTVARTFDEASRITSASDPLGNRSETVFDSEGRPRQAGLYRPDKSDPLRTAYFWHNDAGLPVKTLLPDGRLETWRYGENGRLVEHINGDDIRTLVLKSPGASAEVMIQQAVDGDLRFHVRPKDDGESRARLIDDFGRIVKTTLLDHGDKLASYDEANRLIKLTHADQSSVHYQYDMRGRLIYKQYQDPKGNDQGTTLLTYEGALLKTALDPEQTSQTHYDSLGRKTGESVQLRGLTQTFHTSQSYDPKTGLIMRRGLANGQVMEIVRVEARQGATPKAMYLRSAGVAWLLNRSEHFLPKKVYEKIAHFLPFDTLVEDIQIDPFNGLNAFTTGNGIKTARSFDHAGRLIMQAVDKLGTTRYEYQVGPRIRAIEQQPAHGRPTPASQTASPIRSEFNYSGFGVLMPKEPSSSGLLKIAAYSTGNTQKGLVATTDPAQLEATPGAAAQGKFRSRDTLGRLIDDGHHRYSYSSRGQLAELRDSRTNMPIASYRYDSLGHRIAKTVHPSRANSKIRAETKTTYFLWQDNALVAEINEEGKLITQYFYLSNIDAVHAPRLTPIAKWEGQSDPQNPSKKDRLLFIHADHRGAPLVMTDLSQKVVWALDEHENAWGAAKPYMRTISIDDADRRKDNGPETVHGSGHLNLRLPGQYVDAESLLHDNFNRTYDPRTGHYLQPDPLGYPDGPDAFLYASGDPVNKIDRLGLYQEDVHYYMTYFLASSLGMSAQDAQTLALSTQYIDNNSFTWPLGDKYFNTNPTTQELRLSRYHFTMYKLVQTGPRSVDRIYSTDPNLLNSLQSSEQLQALRGYAMSKANNSCPLPEDQSLQFMGEFLHAFEDTFSHRDQNNVPIPLNAGLGHAIYGEDPDYTYNHEVPVYDPSTGIRVNTINWNVNESRTLAMEAMVYKQISEFLVNRNYYLSGAAQKSKIVPFEILLSVLKEFNATPEGGEVPFTLKKAILDNFLLAQGLSRLDSYDNAAACANRKANLSGLKKGDFAAAILGQDC